MGDWNQQLQDYLVCDDAKSCYAAALGGLTDANKGLHAAAPVEGGWALTFADPSARKVMQEDGSEKSVSIDEFASITTTLDADLRKPGSNPNGLWIANLKYQVCQREDDSEVGDQKVVMIHAKNKKKGVHIIKTKTSVLLGLYDEEKKQAPGVARKAVIAFAQYLIENGI